MRQRVPLWVEPCHLCMEGHLKLRLDFHLTAPQSIKYIWSGSGSISLQDELKIRICIKIQNGMDFYLRLLLFFFKLRWRRRLRRQWEQCHRCPSWIQNHGLTLNIIRYVILKVLKDNFFFLTFFVTRSYFSLHNNNNNNNCDQSLDIRPFKFQAFNSALIIISHCFMKNQNQYKVT